MSRYTDINGQSLEYGYDERGLLETVTDALGRITRVVWDQRVRPPSLQGQRRAYISSGGGGGGSATLSVGNFNPQNRFIWRIIRIEDPFGRKAEFGYDADLNLVSVTDMGGKTSAFGYEGRKAATPEGREAYMTSITRPGFGTWRFSHTNMIIPLPAPAPGTGTITSGGGGGSGRLRASRSSFRPFARGPVNRVTVTDPNGHTTECTATIKWHSSLR